jgi:protein-L-isoaspartate(D-aspartate) O-methyltransferase
MTGFEQARRNMVENQLRPSQIDDRRVLESMGKVPRELFLPASLRGVAYGDDDIDLGQGRFLIEPLALAKLVQSAAVDADDAVLVLGCSTGYTAAIVANLCATVIMLVPNTETAGAIEDIMTELGCDNVVTEVGVAFEGLPSQAPFNVIIAAAAVSAIPDTWTAQLSDGGRLVAVERQAELGKVTVIHRFDSVFGRSQPFDACIPMLELDARQPAFTL